MKVLRLINIAFTHNQRNTLRELAGGYMSLGIILILIAILVLLGVLPTWPHSRKWGYAPSGVVGAILFILVLLFLLGRI